MEDLGQCQASFKMVCLPLKRVTTQALGCVGSGEPQCSVWARLTPVRIYSLGFLALQVQQMHFKLAPLQTRFRFQRFTVPHLAWAQGTPLPPEARGAQDTPGRSWVQGDLHAGRHAEVQTEHPCSVSPLTPPVTSRGRTVRDSVIITRSAALQSHEEHALAAHCCLPVHELSPNH